MKFGKCVVALAAALMLASCATQQAMRVDAGAIANPSPKYRSAMTVRNVTGGAAMNVLTMPGVQDAPLKAALEDSLRANGYLAAGTPKYFIDAQINNLQQPLIGLEYDVVADVTYTVSGGGASRTYPIKAKGKATFSDSPMGADRLRIANERAMQENIKQFLVALK
jgi:hypothetical protein